MDALIALTSKNHACRRLTTIPGSDRLPLPQDMEPALRAVPAADFGGADASSTHVVIIVGENRTFDHLFATYKPRPKEMVNNLLSKGIKTRHERPKT